jgi:hypothetical protein
MSPNALTKNLILLPIAGLMLFAAWWLYPVGPVRPSTQRITSVGTLGKYQLTSPDSTKEFNSEVGGWLIKHGFAPETNTTFADIVGGREWNETGSLLCRRYDTTNRVFVFVPDYHDPSHNVIGFDVAFGGDGRDVHKRCSEFELTRKEFSKRFPSTWEYKPQDAESDAPPDAPDAAPPHP